MDYTFYNNDIGKVKRFCTFLCPNNFDIFFCPHEIGTKIALKHNYTGRFLHFNTSNPMSRTSNQPLVVCGQWNPSLNDFWQVLPANGSCPAPGVPVYFGTHIRLKHIGTGRHLHSHQGHQAPVTRQQEVTAYSGSDNNDHWIVERFDGSDGGAWMGEEAVMLRHAQTGDRLHSHDKGLGGDLQEVTCFGGNVDENDKWRVHFH